MRRLSFYINPCKNILLVPAIVAVFMFVLAGSLSSCDKDPEIITKTIIDTVVVVDTFTIVDFQSAPDSATTFILVRHAETTGVGSNPGLSAEGQARANELNRILGHVELKAIYSTNFNRTIQTAQPVANSKGVTITTYDAFSPATFVESVIASFPKSAVLVVGHSNTTASMLNAMLGSDTYTDLPESEFDNLFIVQVSKIGKASVVHLKYGMQ